MRQIDLSRPARDAVAPVSTVLQAAETIAQSLSEIRKREIDEEVVYFYVIDSEKRLCGVVPSRYLLLRKPEITIGSIMDPNVIRISGDESLETALHILSKNNLLAIPVIDAEQHLIGVVDIRLFIDGSVDVANARFRSDVFQMIGMTLEEGKPSSALRSYGLRMPWIFCNMGGGISCAIISKIYSVVLSEVILLAMFIPLVLSLSESVSMQSMSHSIQFLRKHHLTWKRVLALSTIEWKTLGLIALTSGIVVGALSLCWGEGVKPALVIAVSILAGVSLSGSIGSAVPLLLHFARLDPKVAAGPVVLSIADVVSTTIYLALGTFWLL